MNAQEDKIVGERERKSKRERRERKRDKERKEKRKRETEKRKGTFQDAITTFLGRASNQQLFL